MIRSMLAAAAVVWSGGAAAQPADPAGSVKVAGRPSEVLVLGTPHLSGLPKAFEPAHLRPVLDRLATWKPDVIAIEAMSGAQCDTLRRYPARYADTVASYCWDPAPARAATGLDVPAATAEADRLLAAWPARPTAAKRRRLAAVMLAAGEQASALVQWLRLPEAERRAGEGLDAALVARLNLLRERRNEDYQIAATLAARLGHERVYPVDDHSADDAAASADPAYEATLRRIWSGPATQARARADAPLQAGLGTPEGALALYRGYNAPGMAKLVFDSDFGAALADDTPGQWGRRYVGWWETRNLRMVANMRDVLATRPGARMLAIVGASHKGYYEAYFRPMPDIRVADMAALLR